MTKKKILSLCMVAALATTAFVGGTLAYFTDVDSETNTFTYGNVDIDLNETFTQKSELMPGIDVNKDAWITNTGENDAWVWAEVLIPAALDDADTNSPDAPGAGNSLHMNYPGKFSVEYAQNTDANGKWYNQNLSQLWIMQYDDDAENCSYGYLGQEEIKDEEGNEVTYNKFIKFYTEKLAEKESTSIFMDKVYLDSKVEQGTNGLILVDGETEYKGPWNIIVRAYGMQADGFENTVDESTGKITEYGVVKAWKAYDGEYPATKEVDTTVEP